MIHNVNVSSYSESSKSRPRRRRTTRNAGRLRGEQHKSPLLSHEAVETARWALEEFGEGDVGQHLGIVMTGADSATHRFAADVPGYSGWEWHAVVACPPGESTVTISELALVPAAQALQAPQWVPWSDRIQPGDLGPGDLMPPEPNDPRIDGEELSKQGLDDALSRWRQGDYGPNSEMAKHAPLQCHTCAFFLAWDRSFGLCSNEFSADGHVVHSRYGCGAHSRTRVVDPEARKVQEPFDDEGPFF